MDTDRFYIKSDNKLFQKYIISATWNTQSDPETKNSTIAIPLIQDITRLVDK